MYKNIILYYIKFHIMLRHDTGLHNVVNYPTKFTKAIKYL